MVSNPIFTTYKQCALWQGSFLNVLSIFTSSKENGQELPHSVIMGVKDGTPDLVTTMIAAVSQMLVLLARSQHSHKLGQISSET